jgi:hypothetical protein
LSWGYASLHPRLYAFTRYAGWEALACNHVHAILRLGNLQVFAGLQLKFELSARQAGRSKAEQASENEKKKTAISFHGGSFQEGGRGSRLVQTTGPRNKKSSQFASDE